MDVRPPVVSNNEDLKVRRDFSGTLAGTPTNASEVLVASRLQKISADESALADTFIKMDASTADLDPRPGFVSVSRPFSFVTAEGQGGLHEGVEAATVQFEPVTGKPVKMTREVHTNVDYPAHHQTQHCIATSTVEWDTQGALIHVDEVRRMETDDGPHHIRAGNALYMEMRGGVLHYQESYWH